MARKLLQIHDKIAPKEFPAHGAFGGQVIFGRGKRRVHFKDPFGNDSYYTTFNEVLYQDDNIVTIGGYQFAFSKMFNIGLDEESTLRVGDLNDEAPQMRIGVPRAEYRSPYYTGECSISGKYPTQKGVRISALNHIFGFMMGDGGSREDNRTAIAPDYKHRNLYHAIPFRMTNDGHEIPKELYYGKSSTAASPSGMEPITSYYVKRFDNPGPHIVHCWATEKDGELELVDDSVFASTSSIAIESFVEMNLTVSGYDGRGYHTQNNTSPRVNEFALVSGWYNEEKDDYEALRMITHFTRPPIMLTNEDSIEAIYRLYGR